jgi:hypothetical protein
MAEQHNDYEEFGEVGIAFAGPDGVAADVDPEQKDYPEVGQSR